MPSKNMIRKGKRRQTVKPAYRAHRDALRETETVAAEVARSAEEAQAAAAAEELRTARRENQPRQGNTAVAVPAEHPRQEGQGVATASPVPADEHPDDLQEDLPAVGLHADADGVREFAAGTALAGKRLDAALALALPGISRGRAQLLIEHGQVLVDGKPAKASLKLTGSEQLRIEGDPQPAPLRAEPEDIPLTIVYEDDDLAVVNKPAGMLVHAGSGDAEHNRGTLVNALLFHFQQDLSREGGALRPGIVHRLDKDTSGLILIAKNDPTHQRLAAMFQGRELRKNYLALVHGSLREDEGTVDLPVGRDAVRRTRMTTRRSVEAGARPAVSHWRVLERLETAYGPFTRVEVTIETGRTHQIRVHLAALGHPVVGDTLYGAPAVLRSQAPGVDARPSLARNFLHAAELELAHPRTGKPLHLEAALPQELQTFLAELPIAGTSPPAPGQRKRRVARIQAK